MLLSFELLSLYVSPAAVLLVVFAFTHLRGPTRSREGRLLVATGLFTLSGLAYFAYTWLELTQRVWASGIWFSDNDLLHLGTTACMLYLGWLLPGRVQDHRSD